MGEQSLQQATAHAPAHGWARAGGRRRAKLRAGARTGDTAAAIAGATPGATPGATTHGVAKVDAGAPAAVCRGRRRASVLTVALGGAVSLGLLTAAHAQAPEPALKAGATAAMDSGVDRAAAAQVSACGPQAPALQPLAPGLWLSPGEPGEATAANRGRVVHRLVVADGARTWLLASGPSPVAGRALACVLARETGRRITDVISPWARPEAVLGVAGLPGPVRHWAHDEVATAMAERCPHCVQRLRERLGDAAGDLTLGVDANPHPAVAGGTGPQAAHGNPSASDPQTPVRVPDHRLIGDHGHLGPFDWWRLARAEAQAVTVWRWRRPSPGPSPQPPSTAAGGGLVWWWSPGLLQGDAPFDARDADLAWLLRALQRLQALSARDGAQARHVGEQGPVQGPGGPAKALAYGQNLQAAVRRAIDEGVSETAQAGTWSGLPPHWQAHPWHALNWQRAWRQLEPLALPGTR